MPTRQIAGFLVAACVVAANQAHPRVHQEPQEPPRYPSERQLAESKEAQQHIAKARAAARQDLTREFDTTCTALGPDLPALLAENTSQIRAPRQQVEPIKLFDSLYYFGFNDVGSFAIATSDGIILIDALNTPQEAEEILVPSLRKVGLNPSEIEYVLVGHGHNDHVGGVSYIQERYAARVLMTEADWRLALAGERPERPRPKQDVVVTHGQQLTLGDTAVTLALTPGHTAGSLAFIIPVTHNGMPHTALLLSGVLQTPTPQDLMALERVLDMATARKVDVVLNGHPGIFVAQSLQAMQSVARNPRAPHPMVYSGDRASRYLSIMRECSRARIAALRSN